MSPDMVTLVLPFAALVPMIVLHVAFHRITGCDSVFRSFAVAFCTVLAAYAGLGLANLTWASIPWDGIAWLAADLVAFTGASYAYIDVVSYGESSVRTRIIEEVHRAQSEGLTRGELLSRYSARTVIGLRIERLLANKSLTIDGDRAFLGANYRPHLTFGRLYATLRRILFADGKIYYSPQWDDEHEVETESLANSTSDIHTLPR